MVHMIFDAETTSLSPDDNGMVTCICTHNTENDEVKVFQVKEDLNEHKTLEEFWRYIESIDNPTLVGFNSSTFDLPYIVHRSIVRKVSIPKFDQLDLRLIVNSFFYSYERKATGKLSYWASVLGIPVSTCNGAQMVRFFLDGNYEEIKKHNVEDVMITHALFKRCCEVGLIKNGIISRTQR